MARGAGGGTNVGSGWGMDVRIIGENVARPGAQLAVKVPACLGAVGSAGRKPGVSLFSATGEAQAAHELAQNIRCLVVTALHKTAEPIAAQIVRNVDVVVLDGVAAAARPARAEEGERAHSHAAAACVVK
jgi:hypothetical protein